MQKILVQLSSRLCKIKNKNKILNTNFLQEKFLLNEKILNNIHYNQLKKKFNIIFNKENDN